MIPDEILGMKFMYQELRTVWHFENPCKMSEKAISHWWMLKKDKTPSGKIGAYEMIHSKHWTIQNA